MMNIQVRQALEKDRVIDITTIGRKSGQQRRIEIWFHNLDGRIYITGSPGKRSWYANLLENPDFVFHLKKSVTADIPARARPIVDEQERRELFVELLQKMNRQENLEAWVENSPLVEVTLITEP